MQKHRLSLCAAGKGSRRFLSWGQKLAQLMSLGHGCQSALDKASGCSPVNLNSVCLTGAEGQLQERVKKLGRT